MFKYHNDDVIHFKNITLLVKNIDLMLNFYLDVIGLSLIKEDKNRYELGVGNNILLRLVHDKDALSKKRSTGLYHVAFLLPKRSDLGSFIYNISVNSKHKLTGGSDHKVSEAVYLNDPEGNGIEIYVDYADTSWDYIDNEIDMTTDELDFHGILNSRLNNDIFKMPEDTILGHVHLSVSDIKMAKIFYKDIIGFNILLDLKSAVFLSDENYHHHLGINIWNSYLAKNRDGNEVGLTSYRLYYPKDKRVKLLERISLNNIMVYNDLDGDYILDVSNTKVYFWGWEMKKIKEEVFMDPIYGNIYVKYEVIMKLINTSPFQRLRRIKQLSSVSMIYHGADHARFAHSLGVYNVASKFLENPKLNKALTEREQLLFLTVSLLHDIGHGPHSHSFEDAFGTNHEEIGGSIILNNKEIRTVLDEVDEKFAEEIVDILLKKGKNPLIEQLISSQLDVDRIDYLLRDSYYTGAPYGSIDLDRLIRVLEVKDNKILYRESGINAIESYLISRYHMYFQVYFHRVCRAHEVVLENMYLRIKDLIHEDYKFKSNIDYLKILLNDTIVDVDNYLKLDDYYINGLIKSFLEEEDLILKTLATDYLNRRIWNYVDYDLTFKTNHEDNLSQYEIKYYTKTNTIYGQTYAPESEPGNKIYILLNNGDVSTLKKESKIIDSLSVTGSKKDKKYFYRWKIKYL